MQGYLLCTAEYPNTMASQLELTPAGIDAVLPAGGRVNAEFASAAGNDIKALIQIGGSSILERTIRALRASKCIGRIVVVGPDQVKAISTNAGGDSVLAEHATGSANIMAGIEWLAAQENPAARVIVVTTDMPFITPTSVEQYLRLCPSNCDICVPVVEREPFEKIYPELIRTDSRLADGWFRLGGMFLLNPQTMIRGRSHFEQVFAARKSNLKLAKLIGLPTALRYVTRRLSSEHIVQRASQILNCTGAVVKGAEVPTEIGFDIDLLEEYQYARNRFGEMVDELHYSTEKQR